MPAASGVKVELWINAAWVDVTTDFDYQTGYTVRVGRTKPGDQPQPSSCSVRLRNATGKYTPGIGVLSDGTTVAPYYPNLPGTQLRCSTSTGVDFVGNVTSWAPTLDNGILGIVTITAVDDLDRLSRVTMTGPLETQIRAHLSWGAIGPLSAYWPMTDDGSTKTCTERSGHGYGSLRIANATQDAITFANATLPSNEGSVTTFNPSAATTGQYLTTQLQPFVAGGGYSFEFAFNAGLTPAWPAGHVQCLVGMTLTGSGGLTGDYGSVYIDANGHLNVDSNSVGSILSAVGPVVTDGLWHHCLVSFVSSTGTLTLYLDGTAYASSSGLTLLWIANGTVTVGAAPQLTTTTPGLFKGSLGEFAVYAAPTLGTGYAVPPGSNYSALYGWPGETVSARIKRYLQVAGYSSSGPWDIDTSTVALNSYPEVGQNVTQACQDAANSEGAGAVFYMRAGLPTFRSKAYRIPTSALSLTADAVKDADRNTYQPTVDMTTLVNTQTVTQANAAGTVTSYTATNAASVTQWGIYTGQSITSYAQSFADVQKAAQWAVNANGQPAIRLPQLGLDLLTSVNNLWAQVQATQIGSRIRETNLPTTSAGGSTQRDSYVEGWTKTVSMLTQSIVYDTSSADAPPMGVWNDTTYGRWSASGLTLSSAINATVKTVRIAWTSIAMTTISAHYPLYIQIGAEVLQLTGTPTGTNPQVYTSIANRGQLGTIAAAHSIGAAITIYQPSTWAP